MQTNLAEFIQNTPEGQIAEQILRRCVHCGMCTATCPTFQLTGDELDSPRGRIYQIKQVLEGAPATETIQFHLDRCLTCRACETTCPAKVEYGKLLDIGRAEVYKQLGRKSWQAIPRHVLRKLMLSDAFDPLYRIGQNVRFILPKSLQNKITHKQNIGFVPNHEHERKVLMLEGCVQPTMSPNINAATIRVLDRLGIQVITPPHATCCGALNLHLDAYDDGLNDMRHNIESWVPWLADGIEAVIVNASGCGAIVKEYGYHLRNDEKYAQRAERISNLAQDIVELLGQEIERIKPKLPPIKPYQIAYHAPCSLQHGQKLKGSVENLFAQLGITVLVPKDAHLCCGAAGTYSIFQPELSNQLKKNKLNHLNNLQPDVILSSNIGCITQLAEGEIPVYHWIEYLDMLLSE